MHGLNDPLIGLRVRVPPFNADALPHMRHDGGEGIYERPGWVRRLSDGVAMYVLPQNVVVLEPDKYLDNLRYLRMMAPDRYQVAAVPLPEDDLAYIDAPEGFVPMGAWQVVAFDGLHNRFVWQRPLAKK